MKSWNQKMTLLQFWTILLSYKWCVTERRTYVKKIEISYLLMVLLLIPQITLDMLLNIVIKQMIS